MTRLEKILATLRDRPGLTDRELATLIDGPNRRQQPFNIACRQLEKRGLIVRSNRPDGLIGNWLNGDKDIPELKAPVAQTSNNSAHEMSEDEAKKILVAWLERDGWTTTVAWGKTRGVDIEALRNGKRWLIEVKGCGSRPEMRVNYFIGMLGELLQRMDDPNARYSIATPDIPQFRGLWQRLPANAKRKLSLSMFFVSPDGSVTLLEQ